MSEFKALVESFQEGQKKIVQVMNYRFDKLENIMLGMENRMTGIEDKMTSIAGKITNIEGIIAGILEHKVA